MTIATQITRLQNDKECMRQAIIGKGVSVDASASLDNYACCINNIKQGSSITGLKGVADILVVGGGGSGGGSGCGGSDGGGGGAGGVLKLYKAVLDTCSSVIVGAGGARVIGYSGGTPGCRGKNGGYSCIGSYVVCGGGGGGSGCGGECVFGCDGGSGGGAGYSNTCTLRLGGSNIGRGCGHSGGHSLFRDGTLCDSGSGGGGAGGPGMPNHNGCYGYGGLGISGSEFGLGGIAGGGGGGGRYGGCGQCGGGRGTSGCGTDATTYGSGGGGGGGVYGCTSGAGCQGVVIIRYRTDGSCGFNCATGGTVATKTIGGISYKIHTFTSNGTFTIVS